MANDLQLLNNSSTKAQPAESKSAVGLDESKLHEGVPKCGLNFDEWTSLISEIEMKHADVIEEISLVYDSFLSEFPLCHGYWRKYAAHKTRLCSVDKVIDVFEQAVQSATYSVGIWVDYCSFSISVFEDPADVRRLFKRAISFVGKDYLSYSLWDKYIEFELSQQQWDSLALIYIQTLRFPTKKLSYYHSSFRKLTDSLRENIQSDTGCNPSMPTELEALPNGEAPICCTDSELSSVIKDLLDLSIGTARYSALQKYVHAGEKLYDEAWQLEEKIIHFERKIRRTYFHVKQLDADQLKNWHSYLDFLEMYGDFDWAVKLYERCLIPCASYPEFWMRYVEFMEIKGGRELAMFALERATKTFLKRVPVIHLFNSRFKEQIRDLSGARAAFLPLDGDLDSNFVENIILKANMEKRMGKSTAALNVYREALEMALMKNKLDVIPSLYIHFSRLKHMITGRADAAIEVLIDGIRNVPLCKLLLEELINFVMVQGAPKLISLVDPIVANAISLKPDVSRGWSEQDREDISTLYLKAIDLCGTIHDVMRVWNRHIKLFPQSIRAMPYEDPTWTEALKMTKGGKQTLDSTVTNQPIKDGQFDLSTQLPLEENKQSLQGNQNFQNDQSSNGNEPISCLLGNCNNDTKRSAIDHIHSGEAEIGTEARVQQDSPKVSEHYGEGGNQVDLAPMPMDNSKEDEYGNALGQNLKNLSIGSLSLSPKNNDKIDVLPKASHEGEAPFENSMSSESVCNTDEGALIHNPQGVRSSGSIQISKEVASPSSSPSHDKPIHTQAPSQFHVGATGNRNWHHKHSAGNLHHDSQHRFQSHSRRRPHRTWQDSPRDYQGMRSGQTPDSQDYTSESIASQEPRVERSSQEYNQIQSAQQQNFPTIQSQLPSQGFQEKSQYITPNEEQYGYMQSGQAPHTYEQMWQYYYYQQQQQQYFLQQQQLQQSQNFQQLQQSQNFQQLQQSQNFQQQYNQQQLQMQQHYFQSQQQYPYHVQLQQQYHMQQQLQQTQQQQHLLGLQPQEVSQTDQQSFKQQEHQPEKMEEEQRQHMKQDS
ncbi:uncharacterized protein LOC111434274 isoform X2 [Cucurbita moschata]|uniref:Uncharacterized protein LOC111434274 isoform X2 n=1 Tax=Cucurbita moschata TaxID=3662 RepID=A0A6J1EHQ2_CUCMO|nr:uncharacterized protein LOC111434274 isoform X2 [Cucurbita moschata]